MFKSSEALLHIEEGVESCPTDEPVVLGRTLSTGLNSLLDCVDLELFPHINRD